MKVLAERYATHSERVAMKELWRYGSPTEIALLRAKREHGVAASSAASATSNGVSSTNNGVSPTNDGVSSTNNGVSPTNDGVSSTNNGVSSTNDGVSSTSNGVSSTSNGVSTPSNGVLSTSAASPIDASAGKATTADVDPMAADDNDIAVHLNDAPKAKASGGSQKENIGQRHTSGEGAAHSDAEATPAKDTENLGEMALEDLRSLQPLTHLDKMLHSLRVRLPQAMSDDAKDQFLSRVEQLFGSWK